MDFKPMEAYLRGASIADDSALYS